MNDFDEFLERLGVDTTKDHNYKVYFQEQLGIRTLGSFNHTLFCRIIDNGKVSKVYKTTLLTVNSDLKGFRIYKRSYIPIFI